MSQYISTIFHNANYSIVPSLRRLLFRERSLFSLISRNMATSDDGNQKSPQKFRNRLGQEKSPYLLQHANNPVDWYPWGQDAFDKAKAENKPIFLSVGYSTCHWCHVMERESFESEEIGKLLNDNFVSIKVDREERPDVDRVYMNFIQATSGGGGWPMSVWMTADLKPFAGGTYFPPDDRYYGRPGFKTILQRIAEKWQNHKLGLEEQSTSVLDALIKHNTAVTSSDQLPTSVAVTRCYSQLEKSYEPTMGGFGKAPKFPQPVNFNFMLRRYARDPDSEEGKKSLEMTLYTLRMMAKGGINDHVAKGFHRYSTDNDWHVPHFEKMLYDQGQLAVSYAEAYQATKHEDLAQVARDILEYCSRDLSDKHGGFYSAEDADSLPTPDSKEKKEGAFCVWTEDEINSLLSKPVEGLEGKTVADVFSQHYNVQPNGNVDPYKDPHDELKTQNVLIIQGSNQKTAEKFGLEETVVEKLLEDAKQILFEFRKTRPPPHLDNKMLTAWNGLMISGYAKVGQALGEKVYIDRALKAVEFLRMNLYKPESRFLLRSSYVGQSEDIQQIANPIEGFVDDYSFLIRGLLDLYEVCFDQRLLQWAEELQQKQDELFWDNEDGGYFSNSGKDPSIVMRLKEDQDGAEPSANSVSANNLLRLSSFLDKPQLKEQAEKMFKLFYERLEKIPVALPEMVCALMFYQSTPKQIIIRGDADSDDTLEMIKCVHSKFLPNKVLILADGKADSFLYNRLSVLSSLEKKEGKATAYVCENYSCSQPVNSAEELSQMLN